MDLRKLKEILKEKGEPEYRFDQIYQAVFKDLCFDFDKIYGLPKGLKRELKEKIRLFSLELGKLEKTKGVEKALFKLEDGLFIETVLMRHKYGRKTVCVSSMVGCPLACRFCATGQMGFSRNLNWQEIVDQILFFAQKEKNRKLNVVFMGMGEPFLNYTQILKAIRVLNDKKCDRHRIARPYRKNEQSYIESFNRSLRKECLGWARYKTNQLKDLTNQVEEYLLRYHYHRPHLGLGMRPPLES